MQITLTTKLKDMELVHAHQISFEELLTERIDILIAACGNESRCSHLVQLSCFNADRKIALLFKENPDSPLKHLNYFTDKNFECYEVSDNSVLEIKDVLATICHSGTCENIKLVVDYSSMSKFWYGTIINYFAMHDMLCKNLTVYFCYTPEHYLPSAALKKNKFDPQPVISHENTKTINKPISLILGLGVESEKAQFLCDFFKPTDIHLFLPNPGFDDKHTSAIRDNNKKLLSNVKSTNVHTYPAKNIEEIDVRLRSLSLNLRLNNRVILVSLGPKTFSLASFLLNARYPDIEIWNLCSQNHEYDLQPADVPIVYKAILSSDDDIYD